MCGLAGLWARDDTAVQEYASAMADQLVHRGPDDAGVWADTAAGIALAHRRLSILDLSPAGHQPMHSHCGRYVIVFNGEIYNHAALRQQLEAAGRAPDGGWRGHSDTETLLQAITSWGVAAALKQGVGMFALALWDRQSRSLTLARDRMGEKPLYYGLAGGTLLFASELKALRVYPRFDAEVDRRALSLYLRHNCVPAPYSIYRGIRKLPPGSLVTIGATDLAAGGMPAVEAYWSVRAVAEAGQRDLFRGSASEAVLQLERLLGQAVAGQMHADVPLGAFLSGGVDSSTVVALMQAHSQRPIQTFTIGFHEAGYNEAEHAHAVASHLGTEHTELYVTPAQAMAVIPRLPALYDEPFADSSQIPTFLVSELARRHVTVSLSGDAGDELFAGYNRYAWAVAIWRKIGWLPLPLRFALAQVLTRPSPESWNRAFRGFGRLLPAAWRHANPGDRLHKLAETLAARRPDDIYHALVSHWKQPAAVVLGGAEPPTVLTDADQQAALAEFQDRMMYLDQISYLPDDILVKVDRAAMGVSLETRVPLLDHRVVEFAWRLPLSMKIRHGEQKWLLRQVLYKHVPRRLIERPKMGFGVPIDLWLRGPLRDWAEALLEETRLRREGYFQPGPIRALWREHLEGRRNWSYYLWDVLMFQAWLEAGH